MTALLLSAVGGSRWESGVALSANHLIAVVLSGQHLKRWFDGTTTKAKNKVKSGLLLNVIVSKSSSILELLSSEDQTLLIWGNSFLVLDLGLDVIDAVRGLDIKGDGLTG